MSDIQNVSSRSKIKIFGEYEDVQDIIYTLPKTVGSKYLYCIFTSNLRFKIGITENPLQRIKTHKHGLMTYAGAEIRHILITHPLVDYISIENELKIILENKFDKIGDEFFLSGNYFKALMDIFLVIDSYDFIEVAPHGSYYKDLFKHVETFFNLYPNEEFLKAPEEEFIFGAKKSKQDKKIKFGIRRKIKYLVKCYPQHLSCDHDWNIKINKSILSLDPPSEKRDTAHGQ
jgi:hypothetical protein